MHLRPYSCSGPASPAHTHTVAVAVLSIKLLGTLQTSSKRLYGPYNRKSISIGSSELLGQ